MNWAEYFIRMAMHVATKSKDPSTKIGCVLVGEGNVHLTDGFNGFARGVDETITARWDRPAKYTWICHAETNAVFNAARHGIELLGSTAYLNVGVEPCAGCANALAQAGIKHVVIPDIEFKGVGNGVNYDCAVGAEILHEAGIDVVRITWPVAS
jgi:dCMP deaminase